MKPPVWVNILVSAFILVLVMGSYSRHFDNSFQFDDSHTIENNVFIQDLGNIPLFFTDAQTFSSLTTNQSYRPIVTTTLAIDYWAGKTFWDNGLNTTPYHIDNFFWFVLQVVLMVFLFKKLLDKVKPHDWNLLISITMAGWYAVHTVNAETVNYIIARSDILSTVGVVAAMLIFINGGIGRKYFLYLIPLFLGILAKPTAVMFVPILGIYILLFEWEIAVMQLHTAFGKKHAAGWIHIIVTGALCALGFMLTRAMEPQWIPGGTSKFQYLITQPYVVWHYFTMLFLPTDLTADTDLKAFEGLNDLRVYGGLLFVAVMVLIAFTASAYRSMRPVTFGILWFFLALIPTSSIIPLSEVMNDHRMYFPFIGLILAVSWPAALWIMSKADKKNPFPLVSKAMLVGCMVLFVGYAYGTYQRCEVWQSHETLWKDVTEKSPKNGRGWMNYGLALMGRGEYNGALKCYLKGLEYNPDYAYLHINLGIVYEQLGQPDMAEKHYKYALLVGDIFPEVHYHYGNWLYRHKQYGEAKAQLKRTILMSPAHRNARYALMQLHLEQNESEELRNLANETLQLLPNDERTLAYLNGLQSDEQIIAAAKVKAEAEPNADNYLNLSLAYYNVGQFQECIDAAYKSLEFKPDYAEAYNNICSAHNELKQWDLAVAACNKALELKPDYTLARNNLNWALSQQQQ